MKRLVLVLPLVILFLVIFTLYEKSLEQQASKLLQTEQEKGIAIISNQLETVFSQFVSDLLLVYDSGDFQDFIQDPSPQSLAELEQLSLRIANKKPYIRHIRFLDASGMETIHVINFSDSPALISEPSSLVDRSDTDSFSFGKLHDAHTLYISSLDLKNRHKLDDAHNGPEIALALPVYSEGTFIGVVIVEYDACFLLSFIRDYQSTLTKNITFGLVGNDGNWLFQGWQDCSDFPFEDQANSSLFLEAPDLENRLFSEDSGYYTSSEKAYGYEVVSHLPTYNHIWYPYERRLWTVVSYYPLAELAELSLNPLLQNPAVKWWFSALLFLLGTFFLLVHRLRQADQKQLQVSSVISEYSGDGIVILDEDYRITFCNHAFEVLSGYSQRELMGKYTGKYLPYTIPTGMTRNSIKMGIHTSIPIWVRHRNGNEYLTNRTQIRAGTQKRRDAYTVEVYTSSNWNVAEFTSYISKNEINLPQSMLSGCGESPQDCYCLLVHLKHQLGHDSYNALITDSGFTVEMSEFISTKLGQSETVYAFSTDTYVIFMHENESKRVPYRVESLLREIDKHCSSLPKYIHNRALCGYSWCSGIGDSIPTLLLQASMATDTIDNAKKNKSLLFNEDVQKLYVRNQAILAAIPENFESSSLSLAFQPQIDVESGKILGAEALIRWIHPELGYISPDEFIPILEENQLISKLGAFVIGRGVGFLKANRDFLCRVEPNFTLAINLGAEEFANRFIIDLVEDELQKQEVDPSLLTVELTEHTAVESLHTTGMFMEKLRSIGVGIAIDDFGKGFSSLAYLLDLPIDKIKIDRSFIESYPDSNGITIYKTVLMLAKGLGITVVAEGVETEEQLHFLKQIGCNQYQGFLFSKPLPEYEFLELLKR